MTAQEKDRIECAIRHIQTAVDVDLWARKIAVEAMRKQIDTDGDCISRQETFNALRTCFDTESYYDEGNGGYFIKYEDAVGAVEELPSAQPEQTEMIKEIRKWINSDNRGNADYFIVDKIEEIINRYE